MSDFGTVVQNRLETPNLNAAHNLPPVDLSVDFGTAHTGFEPGDLVYTTDPLGGAWIVLTAAATDTPAEVAALEAAPGAVFGVFAHHHPVAAYATSNLRSALVRVFGPVSRKALRLRNGDGTRTAAVPASVLSALLRSNVYAL